MLFDENFDSCLGYLLRTYTYIYIYIYIYIYTSTFVYIPTWCEKHDITASSFSEWKQVVIKKFKTERWYEYWVFENATL